MANITNNTQYSQAVDAIIPFKRGSLTKHLSKKTRLIAGFPFLTETGTGHPISAAVGIPVVTSDGKVNTVGLFGSIETALTFLHSFLTPQQYAEARSNLLQYYQQPQNSSMTVHGTWEMIKADAGMMLECNKYTDLVQGAFKAGDAPLKPARKAKAKSEKPIKKVTPAQMKLRVAKGYAIIKPTTNVEKAVHEITDIAELVKAELRFKRRKAVTVDDASGRFSVVAQANAGKNAKANPWIADAYGPVLVRLDRQAKFECAQK